MESTQKNSIGKGEVIDIFKKGFFSSIFIAIASSNYKLIFFLEEAGADNDVLFIWAIDVLIIGLIGIIAPVYLGITNCKTNVLKWFLFLLFFSLGACLYYELINL